MYDFNYDFHLTGWECPRCHRIYSPSTSYCLYCNDKRVVWATKTNIDDSGWWQDYVKRTSAGDKINIVCHFLGYVSCILSIGHAQTMHYAPPTSW